MKSPVLLALSLLALIAAACDRPPARTVPPGPATPAAVLAQASPPPAVPPTSAPPSAAPATATATKAPPAETGPVGFPVDPNLRPRQVINTATGRQLVDPDPNGPTVEQVARAYYPRATNDPEANRYGWNCRTHARYEDGQPAIDWYLPEGTPVVATMDGTAELNIIYTGNAFRYYGVNANLYLGLPNPALPLYPFSGPSGGMGVFVGIANGGGVRAEFGHLQPAQTIANVPESAFVPPYSRGYNFDARFNKPGQPWEFTTVARWPVKRGEVVGFVGNSGYSDVNHLHYQIITPDRQTKYCPSPEPLPFSGWLFQRPAGFPG